MDPSTFKMLLRYVYCDTIKFNNVIEAGCLLYATKKYMIPHLARSCVDYIVEHTQVNNVWDVLYVAESLDEEEILKPCIKVMSQYSPEAWSSPYEHLSASTLARLLDQDSSKMSESELWTFVVKWARTECEKAGVEVSGSNVRKALDDAGVMEKVRFLTFSSEEVAGVVKASGVFSGDEINELQACVERRPGAVLPRGLGRVREARSRASVGDGRCSRVILTKRKTWTYGGTVCTRVMAVDSHVLVCGFEVFTRIPSLADFCVWRGNTERYDERLSVRITDSDGNELCNTVHQARAEFNAAQLVRLDRAVWFSPNRNYTVAFELSPGQYPLSQLSSTASSKLVSFRFEDFTNYPEGYLDFSFVSAVIFSL
ncbi:BTB/POZ domain-containing protein 1 isoform X2 [Nilaparvata lugens]|nr:BTB/POZ domain-containing protein 1 isoform X2 [Nilaparvata lugens]